MARDDVDTMEAGPRAPAMLRPRVVGIASLAMLVVLSVLLLLDVRLRLRGQTEPTQGAAQPQGLREAVAAAVSAELDRRFPPTSSKPDDKQAVVSPSPTAAAKPSPVAAPPTINYSQIWMSKSEVDAIVRYMSGTQTYLEWGSGGSTLNFAPLARRRALSIEHNSAWCDKMRQLLASEPRLSRIEYHCVPVPIGHRGWGSDGEFEEGSYVAFQEYIDKVDALGENMFDIVLIDGRARTDCAIKALSYISDDSVVVLHDANRIDQRYKEVLDYYSVLERLGDSQEVAFLKRLPKWKPLEGDRGAVQKILNEKYKGKLQT